MIENLLKKSSRPQHHVVMFNVGHTDDPVSLRSTGLAEISVGTYMRKIHVVIFKPY